jgi:hypothetical protein
VHQRQQHEASKMKTPTFAARRPATLPDTTAAKLAPLTEHPEVAEIDGRLRRMEFRWQEARDRADRARKLALQPRPTRPAIERAEMLADGGVIVSKDPAQEAADADEEMGVLRRGVGELGDQRAELASRLNFEASLRFQPEHVAALRELETQLLAAQATIGKLQAIANTLHAAGYTPNASVLGANIPPSLYRIAGGNNCELAAFRRFLAREFPE